MNAYHPDEYSFYAEAHLPKIRHIGIIALVNLLKENHIFIL